MKEILGDITYKEAEPLKNHCTFRIGGPAKYFFLPKNSDEISRIIAYCKSKDEKYMILGNGSNVLFSDEGFDGFVIQVYQNMNQIMEEPDGFYIQAGALLSKIANTAKDRSLTGMEFAAGIPGTLGGAVVMNAGAYGGEMKDIVEYVDILEPDGSVKRYSCDEMEFSYRHSIVDKNRVVLGAKLTLKEGNKEEIIAEMQRLNEARTSKQPLEYPSAGSTFKRPEGYFAGKLIEDSGLKGYRVGGAVVSEKHCGFVVNDKGASFEDVISLIHDVTKTVEDKFGVVLEPEVKIIK